MARDFSATSTIDTGTVPPATRSGSLTSAKCSVSRKLSRSRPTTGLPQGSRTLTSTKTSGKELERTRSTCTARPVYMPDISDSTRMRLASKSTANRSPLGLTARWVTRLASPRRSASVSQASSAMLKARTRLESVTSSVPGSRKAMPSGPSSSPPAYCPQEVAAGVEAQDRLAVAVRDEHLPFPRRDTGRVAQGTLEGEDELALQVVLGHPLVAPVGHVEVAAGVCGQVLRVPGRLRGPDPGCRTRAGGRPAGWP